MLICSFLYEYLFLLLFSALLVSFVCSYKVARVDILLICNCI